MRTFTSKQNPPQRHASSGPTRSNTTAPGRHRADPLLHVQRAIGSQAVQRGLQDDADASEAGLIGRASPHVNDDFSRIPKYLYPLTTGALQTKLAINKPGGESEQEADRVSEQEMRMPAPHLQHTCPCGGGCPKCQTEQPGREHERLETRRVPASDTGQIAAPPIGHEVLHSPGQPLDP